MIVLEVTISHVWALEGVSIKNGMPFSNLLVSRQGGVIGRSFSDTNGVEVMNWRDPFLFFFLLIRIKNALMVDYIWGGGNDIFWMLD